MHQAKKCEMKNKQGSGGACLGTVYLQRNLENVVIYKGAQRVKSKPLH